MSTNAWIGFNLFVLVMLALDLGVFHRKAHEVRFKEACIWSVIWICLALAFNGGLYFYLGETKAIEFLTGYVVEKSLSIDNIFIFVVTFSAFNIPRLYQHRILFWGILGALVFRGLFIFVGAALLTTFHWLIYVFGGIVLITGLKLLLRSDVAPDPTKNLVYRFISKVLPTTSQSDGGAFFLKDGAVWKATPIFMALVVIELTDVLFAVESIPAILSITPDPFIVYTSNVFAILGLRSLYFLVAGAIEKFSYLTKGLAFILMFIGLKMLLASFVKIPVFVSLIVILSILVSSIFISLIREYQFKQLPK